MNIVIQTIPHENQRYETIGDWQKVDDTLIVNVSELPDARYEFLIGLHEMVEAYLCLSRGVTEKQVDEFDLAFQGDGEPGDASDSPYRKEHFHATNIERLVAEQLGVDWEKYETAIVEKFCKEKTDVPKTTS